MYRIFASLILACVPFLVAPLAASAQVTIDWSPVGNPGNAPDPLTGNGAVDYLYNIGTYDVTVSQYVAFLNSNDPTGANPLLLYNSHMHDPTYGGIDYTNAAPNGSKYSVIAGDGNHPVNYVTWFDSVRFANWMNNGQVPGSTETGAYTLLGGTPTPSNGNSAIRNVGATIFLPRQNEWYKAAYYNPATSSYYLYPTSNDTAPTATVPTATPNSANYLSALNYPDGALTDVGAYSGTTSPYGAFDMGGNIVQWNEDFTGDSHTTRGQGGSTFFNSSAVLLSTWWGPPPPILASPDLVFNGLGFRLASIPEPSTLVLVTLGGLALLACRRRCVCHDRAISARHGEIC